MGLNETYKKHYKELFDSIPEYWDEIYDSNTFFGYHYQKRREGIVSLIKKSDPKSSMKILDAGCGAGGYFPEYLSIGLSVEGIDGAEGMISKIKEVYKNDILDGKVHASVADIEALEFDDNSFDLIVSSGVLMYLPSMVPALKESMRVLKSRGYAVINIDNHRNLATLLDIPNIIASFYRKISRKSKTNNKSTDSKDDGSCGPVTVSYTPASLRAIVTEIGFDVIDEYGHGFGPVRLFNKRILPDKLNIFLYWLAQPLFKIKMFGPTGFTYSLLVRKK